MILLHTPGKLISRNTYRTSRHQWTQKRIVHAANQEQAAGNASKAARLFSMIGGGAVWPSQNQGQRRRARRALFASGVTRAVAFRRF